mmetsp:Transcript_178515/g.572078  ORF Transcript_178515/g.572078 Transcript_178515/m.572078 type:complete len:258 (+) Transcript_178515:982-1755(+)
MFSEQAGQVAVGGLEEHIFEKQLMGATSMISCAFATSFVETSLAGALCVVALAGGIAARGILHLHVHRSSIDRETIQGLDGVPRLGLAGILRGAHALGAAVGGRPEVELQDVAMPLEDALQETSRGVEVDILEKRFARSRTATALALALASVLLPLALTFVLSSLALALAVALRLVSLSIVPLRVASVRILQLHKQEPPIDIHVLHGFHSNFSILCAAEDHRAHAFGTAVRGHPKLKALHLATILELLHQVARSCLI